MRTVILFGLVLSLSTLTVAACGSSEPAVDDEAIDGGVQGPGADASPAIDAGPEADGSADDAGDADVTDAAEDATSRGDSALPFDASALPPALAVCATCLQTTCQPQVSSCLENTTCVGLLECVIVDRCLDSGQIREACVADCGDKLGLSPLQLVLQLVELSTLVTSCSTCLPECTPDGGLSGGL